MECSRLLIEYDLFLKILPAQNFIFTDSKVLITIPGFRLVHWLALLIHRLLFNEMLGYDLLRHLNCYLDMATRTILPNDPSIYFPDEKHFAFYIS